jgi:hypothetical protein
MQENPESAYETPGLDLPHTLRFRLGMRIGAAAWPANHRTDGGAITLRGLEIYVEGGLADEGENGSQPNN